MSIKSEGEELDFFLAELQIGEIKEIAGLESGFPNLSRCLNGFLPGLYLLIGPPSCGKTAFAKQLCDQVALQNSAPVIFFTFAEKKKDLRIRTLARLTGLESREIRKGSSFLLHWYGAPKSRITDPEQMPPSWEKLKTAAAAAKSWLDLIYLFESNGKTDVKEIENRICEVKEIRRSSQIMAVIDDSQHLGASDCPIDTRLPFVVEQLQAMA
jgi:replicative DNA helicase